MIGLCRVSGVGTVRLIGIVGSTIVVIFHYTHFRITITLHLGCWKRIMIISWLQKSYSNWDQYKWFSTVSAQWIFCIFANLCKNLVLELQIMSLIREMQGMQFSKCSNIKLIPVLENELFSLKPNIAIWKIPIIKSLYRIPENVLIWCS